MEKEKIQKIARAVGVIAAVALGFWILSFGAMMLWEVVKSMYQNW